MQHKEERISHKYDLQELAKIAGGQFGKDTTLVESENISRHFKLHNMLDVNLSYFMMIDYQKMNYLYVSKSIKKVLGYENNVLLKSGIDFLFDAVYQEDRDKLRAIHKTMFQCFYNTPIEDRLNLKFDFNIRLIRSDKIVISAWQQTTFVELTEGGQPMVDFSTFSDISDQNTGSDTVLKVFKFNNQNFKLINEFNIFNSKFTLTTRQEQIIKLISIGLTSCEVSERLGISLDTVKNHRKKILQTTGSKNIAEAIRNTFGYGYAK